MKHLAIVTLMLNFGVAGIYAQPGPEKMTLSGTAAASTISLHGTPASEYHLAGTSRLGQVDVRVVSISTPSAQQPYACSGQTKLYGSAVAGAGVFSFENGGLLKVSLTGGSDCIDLLAGEALCIRIFQITGGTGRFKNVSGGTITLTMSVVPVLEDGPNNPVFFAVTGAITGTVPGLAADQRSEDGQL